MFIFSHPIFLFLSSGSGCDGHDDHGALFPSSTKLKDFAEGWRSLRTTQTTTSVSAAACSVWALGSGQWAIQGFAMVTHDRKVYSFKDGFKTMLQ